MKQNETEPRSSVAKERKEHKKRAASAIMTKAGLKGERIN